MIVWFMGVAVGAFLMWVVMDCAEDLRWNREHFADPETTP